MLLLALFPSSCCHLFFFLSVAWFVNGYSLWGSGELGEAGGGGGGGRWGEVGACGR